MMCGGTVILLLAFASQVDANNSMDKFVDKWVGNFYDRAQKVSVSPLYHADLDDTTLGKPTTPPPSASARAKVASEAKALTLVEICSSSEFLEWSAFLFAAWGALTLAFGKIPLFQEKPGGCAHQVVVLVPFVFLAARGSQMWFFDDDFKISSEEEKIWGQYPGAISFVLMMFAFQIWDFVVTLVTPELCKPEHLAHHGATSLLALVGLMNGPHGFLMYYAAFFFGVSEVSSIPLSAVDLFRMNKKLAEAFKCVNEVCRVSFAVLFLTIRCIYWPYVSFDFWKAMLSTQVPIALLVVWLTANLALTGLQFFWGSLIVKALMKMLKGDKSGRETEA